MKLNINYDLINDVIYGRIKRFFNSDSDDKYKRFIFNLDIIPYINNKNCSYYGFMNILPDIPSVRRFYHIEEDHRTFKFENSRCFAILEVCPKQINIGPRLPRTELRETIAHELAHMIDMRIYGLSNRNVRFHGPKWQYFAKQFGCLDLHFDD